MICKAKYITPKGEVILTCDLPVSHHTYHHDPTGIFWSVEASEIPPGCKRVKKLVEEPDATTG